MYPALNMSSPIITITLMIATAFDVVRTTQWYTYIQSTFYMPYKIDKICKYPSSSNLILWIGTKQCKMMISNELVSIHWTCHTISLGLITSHTHTNYYHYRHLIGSNNNEKCAHARSSIFHSAVAIHFRTVENLLQAHRNEYAMTMRIEHCVCMSFSIEKYIANKSKNRSMWFCNVFDILWNVLIEFGLAWFGSTELWQCRMYLTGNEWAK